MCHLALYLSGYWGQPEQTAQRFEDLADGSRCFRTGDQAVRRSDGVFEHRGRLDQMVKVRGYLVEPSEVEAALLATGEVAGAAVLGLTEPGAPTRLVAYVVPGGPETSAASVRRALRQKVPTYMVPTSVVIVADLPRNANGKIDRVGLLQLPVPAAPPPVQPRDHVELQLVVAWADVLGVDSVGVHDDFFELGGDSLAAEAAMAALCEDFGLTLPTSVLLEAPTVAELAVKVRAPNKIAPGRRWWRCARPGPDPRCSVCRGWERWRSPTSPSACTSVPTSPSTSCRTRDSRIGACPTSP